jgi:hypothetical protein
MNQRNSILARNFWSATEYDRTASENRAVKVTYNFKGNVVYVYAMLHNNAIARRTIETEAVEVRTCGWATRTTANAINACLPPGWRLSQWKLTSPKGSFLTLRADNEWVMIKDPMDLYLGN